MAYIGKSPVNGFFSKQVLTTDGSTTAFALDFTIASSTSILVFVGGVVQEPESSYTLSGGGTGITFTTAPAANSDTYIHYLGQAIVQNILDVNGAELVLDQDADTTIHASTDDQIDFKLGGSDVIAFKTTGIHLPDGEKYFSGTGDDVQVFGVCMIIKELVLMKHKVFNTFKEQMLVLQHQQMVVMQVV